MLERMEALSKSFGWYNAITLAERLAAWKSVSDGTPDAEPAFGLDKRRFEAWRSQEPFTSGDHFIRRLAYDGITEEEFSRLLSEPIETVPHRSPAQPAWLEKLDQVFSQPRQTAPEDGALDFLKVIEPLIADGQARLELGIRALAQGEPALLFDPDAIIGLLSPLINLRALPMLDRTLALEVNVARLSGLLQGETPEERFQSYIRQLQQCDNMLALLEEYSVLARELVRAVDQWVAVSLEFLERLTTDWKIICATFNANNDPGRLVKVSGGAGDSHRQGRSVMIATFESGLSVVYKPRSMALDLHFQELLAWLNERGNHAPFRTLKVLDCGRYGWVEFVKAAGCADAQEIRRFYRRQGGYLALLYLLDATDFHAENLIAEGEHPVLIDLEALFHPRIRATAVADPADLLARKALESSVLRIGLLPQRIWANDESDGVDISGLGSTPDQLTPHPAPQWQGHGTDEMRVIRKRVAIGMTAHRPSLTGADVQMLDYAEDISAGFSAIYRVLQEHQHELRSEGGPLARFATDDVRAILRATSTYGVLLRESYHPDMLRNALDRDRLFDRLWMQVEYLPHLEAVIRYELEDLHQGDIPMFTSRPNSCDLWSSSNERIPAFFEEPSLDCVGRRLERLGDEDLERQLWFVNASLATAATNAETPRLDIRAVSGAKADAPGEPGPGVSREHLLEAAEAVAGRLERMALRENGVVTWIGLTQPNERHWTLTPVGVDLYDGLPGVGLFFAYLYAVTGQERFAELSRGAIRATQQCVRQLHSSRVPIGGFDGWGGVIYALTHVSYLLGDFTLLEQAREAVELLPPLIERDEALDIISGSAGCIASLLSLYRFASDDRILAVAQQCGERLIARSTRLQQGVAWLTPAAKTKALSGFAHGAAGMAWALMELSAVTGEERFRDLALEAIAYERSVFSTAHQNWLDLRQQQNSSSETTESGIDHCSTAWCHGAPGIGLARLATLRHLNDAAVRKEIDTALRTTIETGFGRNHSLCHGDLGNLDFLFEAGELLTPSLRARADQIRSCVVDQMDQKAWRCGNPLQVESPGLMTGLAGIGYGLLRLAEPSRVPSVLLLAPPRGSLS
jgi:type 2 lantibiotic biosynthesis protein LanM